MPSGVKAATAGAITAENVNTDSESGVLLFLGTAEGVLDSADDFMLVVAINVGYGVADTNVAYNSDSDLFSLDLIVYGIRSNVRFRLPSARVDRIKFWLGWCVFPPPVLGRSARKDAVLEWVLRMIVWCGYYCIPIGVRILPHLAHQV